MNIVKKEILELSEKETKAVELVTDMCYGIKRESANPELIKLAEEIIHSLNKLWGYVE